MNRLLSTPLLLALTLLALVACGGGGGVSSNPQLAEIRLSSGSISPAFSPDVTRYEAKVGNEMASITVTPVAASAGASIKVNGVSVPSGAASAPIPLEIGFNTLRIEVVSQTQIHTRTYELVVERLTASITTETGGVTVTPGTSVLSDDATLNALAFRDGLLDQFFQSTNLRYTASVPFTVSSTTITAAPSNANATMKLDGQTLTSGQPSAPLTLREGLNTFTIVVTAQDGRTTRTYTLDITRATATTFAQRALLQSAQVAPNGDFGFSIANNANFVAVGAPGETVGSNSKAGAVYIFDRSKGWASPDRVVSPNAAANGQFGYSVALDGDVLAIGAFGEYGGVGRVYVYRRSGTTWAYVTTVVPASSAFSNVRFGYNVALSNGTLAVSTLRGNDGNPVFGGTVYVYLLSGSTTTLQQSLSWTDSGSTDRHGQTIALSGNRLAIGSFDADSECTVTSGNGGNVRLYERTGSTWTLRQTLTASNAGGGDRFGFSLALDGDRLAVGAPCEDSAGADPGDNSATQAGAVYVFEPTGGVWSERARIKATAAQAHDLFGYRVALNGTTLFASAILSDRATTDAGALHVFVNQNGTWTEQLPPVTALQSVASGRFGASLARSGNTIAVGANLAQNAFVFE